MSELPEKMWLRRGEVRRYLCLTDASMTKLIESGVLRPKYFRGMSRAFFERGEVLKVRPEAKAAV